MLSFMSKKKETKSTPAPATHASSHISPTLTATSSLLATHTLTPSTPSTPSTSSTSTSTPSTSSTPVTVKKLINGPTLFKKCNGRPLIFGDDKKLVEGGLDEKIKAQMYNNVAVFNSKDPALANLPSPLTPWKNHYVRINGGLVFKMCLVDVSFDSLPFGSCFLNYMQRESVHFCVQNMQGRTKEFVDTEDEQFLVSLIPQPSFDQFSPIIFLKIQVDLFKKKNTNGEMELPKNTDVTEILMTNQLMDLFGQTLYCGQKIPMRRSDKFADLAAVLTVKEIKVPKISTISSTPMMYKDPSKDSKDVKIIDNDNDDDANDYDDDNGLQNAEFGVLSQMTVIDWDPLPYVSWTPIEKTFALNKNFNMKNIAVGGLDREFMIAFRRLIGTRFFPRSSIEKLGIKHPKGMLLFGSPGTGKTALCRVMHQMLGLKTPFKLVNGPELLAGIIGEAEKNLRNVFAEAVADWKRNGKDADLYLIVIDEIDALCRARSSDGGVSAQVNANLVATMLTMLDGFDSPENIIVIGTTNRKDMIDPALLRPGRMEILLEIGLPNCQGREEIFKVHTRTMAKNHLLGEDFDIKKLAEATKNYSGAEIEGVVKAASSLAVSEKIDMTDGTPKIIRSSKYQPPKDPIIMMRHFEAALQDIHPAYGRSKEMFRPVELLDWGKEYLDTMNELTQYVNNFKYSEKIRLMTILIEGTSASGQSSIAKNLAFASDFALIKLISPETCGNSESEKINNITTIFEDAYRSTHSIIVIDNIERLLEYSSVGPRFSNAILQKLLVCLNRDPPNSFSRLMLLTTTSNFKVLQRLELEDSFKIRVEIPMISNEEHFINLFELLDFKMNSEEVKKLAQKLTPLGIKNFILMMDTVSKTDSFSSNRAEISMEEFYSRCKGLGFIKKHIN